MSHGGVSYIWGYGRDVFVQDTRSSDSFSSWSVSAYHMNMALPLDGLRKGSEIAARRKCRIAFCLWQSSCETGCRGVFPGPWRFVSIKVSYTTQPAIRAYGFLSGWSWLLIEFYFLISLRQTRGDLSMASLLTILLTFDIAFFVISSPLSFNSSAFDGSETRASNLVGWQHQNASSPPVSLPQPKGQCARLPDWYPTGVHPVQFQADCIAAAQDLFLKDVHYGNPDMQYEITAHSGPRRTILPLLKTPRRYTISK